MQRVFMVHRWSGSPESDWYPWIAGELKKKGFDVHVLKMPNSDNPKIDEWVNFLSKNVATPDEDTFFIGHSIGCQTILRYLGSLDGNKKVGRIVLVAPWLHLDNLETEEEKEIARPWLETPIDFEKVKSHLNGMACIFSNNDPFVPLSDKEIFKEMLGAEIAVESEKGHFTQDDGVTQLPIVISSLLEVDSLFDQGL